ncbi:COG4315 family predicted lipoprotein [Amycolatopsis sp. NPDC004772]
MIRIPRPVVPAAVCLTALALLTACTAGAATTSGGGYAAGGAAGMQMPGMQQGQVVLPMPQGITADPNNPAKSQIRAAKTFDLGLLLVDGTGYTIYRYDRDTPNPSRSNCTDACAAKWIPVKAGGNLPPIDVDQSLIGQITRDDGSQQLTLAGWPLYHFTGDQEPADTSGQGADQAWYPIAPDGKKITLTQDEWRQNAFGV